MGDLRDSEASQVVCVPNIKESDGFVKQTFQDVRKFYE
jgi:hypothetical protein